MVLALKELSICCAVFIPFNIGYYMRKGLLACSYLHIYICKGQNPFKTDDSPNFTELKGATKLSMFVTFSKFLLSCSLVEIYDFLIKIHLSEKKRLSSINALCSILYYVLRYFYLKLIFSL